MLRWHVIGIFIIAGFIIGCAGTEVRRSSDATQTPASLDVALALKFDDIPVPAGFKVSSQESFVFQNEILRVGILKYTGAPSADQVANFYKDQMSLYSWRFLNMLEYGRRILNFDREDQSCIIVIEPTKFNTMVTITVAPKAGRAATFKSKKSENEEAYNTRARSR